MELKITTLDGKDAGKVSLSKEIFGLEPRADILQRCVNWQLTSDCGDHSSSPRALAFGITRCGKRSCARSRVAVPSFSTAQMAG